MTRRFLPTIALLLAIMSDAAFAQDLPPTRTVNVGDIEMRVRVAGLDQRAPGTPVVVLEAGAGQTLETWNPVFPSIAAFAPVIAYDRSGLGQSQYDGVVPMPEHVAATLRQLLRNLGAEPPFVLVGHSWGGPLVRRFAGDYPAEIAGLVYLDPMDWETTLDDRRRIFLAAGGTAEQFEASLATPALADSVPVGGRAEAEVITTLNREALASAASKPLPVVPQAVLLPASALNRAPNSTVAPDRGVSQTPPAGGPPPNLDVPRWNSELRALKVAHATEWARHARGGLLVIATGATHYVHRVEPRLVTEAIRHILDVASRTRTP